VPKLQLDDLLTQLVDRAQDVMATQGRLRGLLRANQAVVGNMPLPALLRQIVHAACELAQARYGALGVIDTAGGLEQFIHVGVDDETAARIGPLPAGQGLLGALIKDPRPIRLPAMSADPRSVGFPAGHPPMTNFLGVPILVRGAVFGNLYLTERRSGDFTAEDEELVSALAATAGVAIENARLYEEARRRQDWLQASTEVTQQLLAADGTDPLTLIAEHALHIADADIVAIVLPTPDGSQLMVEVAAGVSAGELTAVTYPMKDSLVGVALTTRQPVIVGGADASEPPTARPFREAGVGPVMALPLDGPNRPRGALLIARLRGRHHFSEAELEMATTFARHAAMALELADARADQQRIVLLEDRDRIARDLHDHVIQRLFGIGMTVQSLASNAGAGDRADRLSRVVDEIDETIRQTRTTIFQLHGPLAPESGGMRAHLLTVIGEISESLGLDPGIRFVGPLDTLVTDDLADDLLAVLREALTNVARHAHAARVDIEITATSAELVLQVQDDGDGIGETQRRSGLANLRQRAEARNGALTLGPSRFAEPGAPPVGTALQWRIALHS
jgi:signal transduction histidine kinase